MATARLPMRKAREILRQKLQCGLSHRQVAKSVGVSPSSVADVIGRATVAQLDWARVAALSEDDLQLALYGRPLNGEPARPMPDLVYLHTELRRKGVTLALLHLEYLEKHPDGYRYTAFCEMYKRWRERQSPVMRQQHVAGEKLFVDYSGDKPHIIDASTGELIELELFVAVLGASNLTYAEATRTQTVGDWTASHVRAFEYFGGVSRAVVPDQLKSGVSRSCRYEPAVQRTYEELAEHYGTTVLPARPGHARDKAKVEVGVLIAQRWVLARLRHHTFFSLDALNERIAELCEELNARPMRVYRESRRQLFERVERAALLPLPRARFVYGAWKLNVTVNIDYHVDYEGHYYSAPYTLLHEKLDVRATATTVELYLRGERITSHARSYERGKHTTKPEHMPKAHQKHLQWSPSRIVSWASTVGTSTAKLCEAILNERRHPEQGYRSCLGILRLGKKYGPSRLEAACTRALAVGARSYRHVDSILSHGLDQLELTEQTPAQPPRQHENVRGRDYYH
jgi:transposase